MTEIDIGSLNLDDHDHHDHCDHQPIIQLAKPKLISVFENHSKSQFSQRLTVHNLPILSVVSPMKLKALINQSDIPSINQSAVIDILKLVMQCQSERSQVYAVFESAFAGYIETVQSANQSNNQLNQSDDQALQKVLVEQALRDYTQLCQRIILLFKHCSMNIKSIISRLANVTQEVDQSNDPSQIEDILRIVTQLQQLQSLEQSKLALTIQRQDASSQFIVSMKQPYNADYLALMDETRVSLGEVIVDINDILDEIREFIYSE